MSPHTFLTILAGVIFGALVVWLLRRDPKTETTTEMASAILKKLPEYAQTNEEIAASKEAKAAWVARCKANVAALEEATTEPAWKIRHAPEGYYVILQRSIWAPDKFVHFDYCMRLRPQLHELASYWNEKDDAAHLDYEPFKDDDAPREEFGHPRPKQFNTHDEAEAYLFRLVAPQDHETSYDFPPLVKRKAKAK